MASFSEAVPRGSGKARRRAALAASPDWSRRARVPVTPKGRVGTENDPVITMQCNGQPF